MSPAANVVLETTEALGSRAGLEADLAMDVIGLLAQVGFSLPPDPPASAGGIVPIDALWGYVTTLRLVEALIFISFGVVWLFYGWRVFKILVTISFGLMGLFAGVYIQRSLIGGEVVWLATLFMLLFGFLAVWFMKWSVSVLGALAGAVLAGGAWLAFGLPEQMVWAGVAIGLIGGGLLSYIVFKAAVMLFTCLGGSVMLMTGILAILYSHLDGGVRLQNLVYQQRWFLVLMLGIPMVVGMVTQHKFMKNSDECRL